MVLYTHDDALFAPAPKAPQRGKSDGQIPPPLLLAVTLRHILNAGLLSPDG